MDEFQKRLIFLQKIGASNYELLESLLQGDELERTQLADLKQVLEHFQPKKLLMTEHFGLMSGAQKPGQTLRDFMLNCRGPQMR